MWYYQNMNILSRTISWLTIIILVSITVIAYICPMTFGNRSFSMFPTSNICQAAGTMNGSQAGCVDTHLATIAQFLGDIPQTMNLFFALAVVVAVYSLFFRKLLLVIFSSVFNRLKHRYLFYQTFIKSLIEQKILKYLNLLGNFTVVSFS